MCRAEALQGVRMIRFRSVFERYGSSEPDQTGAAALLGVSERTFRRWAATLSSMGRAASAGTTRTIPYEPRLRPRQHEAQQVISLHSRG